MTRPTLKEKQRRLREDVILDAASELMLERGYADTSIDDIIERVGVARATLYQHFPSKEAIAVQVIVREMERGEAEIRALDPAMPVAERLAEILRRGFHRRLRMTSAHITLPPDSVRSHPDLLAQQARTQQAFETLVDEARAAGEIATALPTPLIIQFIDRLFDIDLPCLIADSKLPAEAVIQLLVSMVLKSLSA